MQHYFLMGNYIDAIVAYKQGLALEPDSVTLKLGLSESREAQRERPDFSALERAETRLHLRRRIRVRTSWKRL